MSCDICLLTLSKVRIPIRSKTPRMPPERGVSVPGFASAAIFEPDKVRYGWVGHIFPFRCPGPSAKGPTPIDYPSRQTVLRKKVQGIVEGSRAVFNWRRRYLGYEKVVYKIQVKFNSNFTKKIVWPLAPRGQLQLLIPPGKLFYAKSSRASWKVPGQFPVERLWYPVFLLKIPGIPRGLI